MTSLTHMPERKRARIPTPRSLPDPPADTVVAAIRRTLITSASLRTRAIRTTTPRRRRMCRRRASRPTLRTAPRPLARTRSPLSPLRSLSRSRRRNQASRSCPCGWCTMRTTRCRAGARRLRSPLLACWQCQIQTTPRTTRASKSSRRSMRRAKVLSLPLVCLAHPRAIAVSVQVQKQADKPAPPPPKKPAAGACPVHA